MSDVTITIQGLDKLQNLAKKFPVTVEKYTNLAIARSLNRVFGEEKVQAPVGVSGNLRDNWQVTVGRFEGSLVSRAPYAADVETGQPLKVFPSGASLLAWAANKGLNAYAVAKAIAKRGHLIANPFLQRAVTTQANNVQGEFKNAMDNVLKEVVS